MGVAEGELAPDDGGVPQGTFAGVVGRCVPVLLKECPKLILVRGRFAARPGEQSMAAHGAALQKLSFLSNDWGPPQSTSDNNSSIDSFARTSSSETGRKVPSARARNLGFPSLLRSRIHVPSGNLS